MIDVNAFYKALRDVSILTTENLVKEHLKQNLPAQDVLSDGLIGAMNILGKQFKAKEVWVPDVLLAARNMHAGIALLKPLLMGVKSAGKGTIVIGTVHGDIHDIGKNIVAVLMEGAGFEVIDLGVNVPTENFLAAIDKHQPAIIGLSALLTTTMMEMGKVIESVRTKGGSRAPKIIVGGAPLNQQFATEIGADGYGEDATAGVELALKLVGK
ncbi:MAG: corrinoid protein [Chloroflexota bacterium]